MRLSELDPERDISPAVDGAAAEAFVYSCVAVNRFDTDELLAREACAWRRNCCKLTCSMAVSIRLTSFRLPLEHAGIMSMSCQCSDREQLISVMDQRLSCGSDHQY